MRDDNGNYPERDPDLLPLAERERQRVIRDAVEMQVGLCSRYKQRRRTKSGARTYWACSVQDALEEIVDPGLDVVTARLSRPYDGLAF